MKIAADYVATNSFVITCPKCKHRHNFERSGFQEYVLDNDNTDTFEIDNFGHMVPDFVCRNLDCEFMERLWIFNLSQE